MEIEHKKREHQLSSFGIGDGKLNLLQFTIFLRQIPWPELDLHTVMRNKPWDINEK